MKYVVSDVHAEYELFVRLLNCISFSKEDEMYKISSIASWDYTCHKFVLLLGKICTRKTFKKVLSSVDSARNLYSPLKRDT